MKHVSIVMSIAWISCMVAASIGLYLTKSANCLWVMIFPLFLHVEVKSDDDSVENDINKND